MSSTASSPTPVTSSTEGAFINEQPYMNKNAEFSLDNFTQVSLPTYRYKGDIYIVPIRHRAADHLLQRRHVQQVRGPAAED